MPDSTHGSTPTGLVFSTSGMIKSLLAGFLFAGLAAFLPMSEYAPGGAWWTWLSGCLCPILSALLGLTFLLTCNAYRKGPCPACATTVGIAAGRAESPRHAQCTGCQRWVENEDGATLVLADPRRVQCPHCDHPVGPRKEGSAERRCRECDQYYRAGRNDRLYPVDNAALRCPACERHVGGLRAEDGPRQCRCKAFYFSGGDRLLPCDALYSAPEPVFVAPFAAEPQTGLPSLCPACGRAATRTVDIDFTPSATGRKLALGAVALGGLVTGNLLSTAAAAAKGLSESKKSSVPFPFCAEHASGGALFNKGDTLYVRARSLGFVQAFAQGQGSEPRLG